VLNDNLGTKSTLVGGQLGGSFSRSPGTLMARDDDLTDAEFAANLLVQKSGNDQRHYLAFTLGERIETVRQAPPPRSESSPSRIFHHSGITVAFKTTFEVFTRVDSDNSLERLTEGSAGLVTDRPSNVYELLVALL